MQLAQLQIIMARLSTDAGLRQAWRQDPDRIAREWNLDAQTCATLHLMDAGRLDQFARGLIGKRRRAVARLLPRTAAALGDHFTNRFDAYAATRPLPSEQKYRQDAIGFAAFLSTGGDAIPPFAADLARYEAICLHPPRIGCCRFRCDVRPVHPRPMRKPTLGLWLTLPGGRAIHALLGWI